MKFIHTLLLACGTLGVLFILLGSSSTHAAALENTPTPTSAISPTPEPISSDILAVSNEPRYAHSQWGLLVVDLKTGKTIQALDEDKLFVPGSTAKLFSTAAALNALGADYRFITPVYRRGTVSADGTLDGDLILVASGDPTMGGRLTSDGKIAFTDNDHGDANALPSVDLTPQDPLGGLNDLASQVAASGILTVTGQVVIDDRLFETRQVNAGVLSPIVINENLLDVIVTPGTAGNAATIDSRPHATLFQITNDVKTVAAGEPTDISIMPNEGGKLVVSGQIAADAKPAVRVYSVPDPAVFARALFIDALGRAGIKVNASAAGPNPTDQLPASSEYSTSTQVAQLTSPPFSEVIKLVNKVSQNYDANMLPMFVGLKNGTTNYDEAMSKMLPFFEQAGVDSLGVSLADGEGGADADFISPRAEVQLLQYMATRDDFPAYKASLPILGVDGSLAGVVGAGSPAIGKVFAKTGTRGAFDTLHQRPILVTKSLAGYMSTQSGRELAFAVFVGPAPITSIQDILQASSDLGHVTELIYDRY